MKLSYQDIWISEIIRYEIKYSFFFHYCMFFVKLNLIYFWYWEVHQSLQIKKWKKWDICERTILWKIIHWFGKKWSLIEDTWKKLYLFKKFDFQNSNYADHQILKRKWNIKNSFFVIKYRSCFTSKHFFILQNIFFRVCKNHIWKYISIICIN